MAFNNFNSGKQFKELDKNTNSFRLKNSTAVFPSAMILGYWNSTLTIKLHPALPESQRSTEKVFDYNTFIMGILTAENALVLLEAIKENINTILEEPETFDSFGVSSGNSFIEIAPQPGMEEVRDSGIFLNLYTKIDENGVPGEVLQYKFNNRNYFKNFKVSGKTMEKKSLKLPSEFLMFVRFLEEGVKGLSGGIAHGIRNANKYEYTRNVSNINRMMEKLGISQQDFNGGNRNSGTSSFFSNVSNNNSNSESTFNYSVDTEHLQGGSRFDLDD